MNGQVPLLPGPPGVAAPPGADGPRRCKQPGCGTELPAAAGRGAPRLFCSPACSRKWHNDSRLAGAGPQQAAAAGGAMGGLSSCSALAGTWQARAENAEQQLSLERDRQRRLGTQSRAPGSSPATRPAKAARTAAPASPDRSAAGPQPAPCPRHASPSPATRKETRTCHR